MNARPQKPGKTDRSGLALVTRVTVAIFVVAALLVALVFINVLQTLSFILARPVSDRSFRAFNRYVADKWWGSAVLVHEKLIATPVFYTGDNLPPRENAIVVSNHQSGVDIVLLLGLGFRKHRLGDMKWFAKDPLKYIPGIGWGMFFLDCLYVKRNWTADRASIDRTFARIMDKRLPIWLVSFLEGTRATPVKLARSREYALKRGMAPTDHVLIPRTRGFAASIKGLRGHVRAVYDVTIGYEAKGGRHAPGLVDMVLGRITAAHLHVRRYLIADLPKDDEALGAWAIELFREKNDLLAYFRAHGHFPATAVPQALPVKRWLSAKMVAR